MLAQQRVVVLPHWLETPVGRLISGSRRPSDLQITQASGGQVQRKPAKSIALKVPIVSKLTPDHALSAQEALEKAVFADNTLSNFLVLRVVIQITLLKWLSKILFQRFHCFKAHTCLLESEVCNC